MTILKSLYTGVVVFSFSIVLSACVETQQQAAGPDPAYVSETQYLGYSCKQIHAEMNRVSRHMDAQNQAGGSNQILGAAVAAFAISRGYAVGGGDDSDDVEIRRLRNQYDVLEQLAIKKDCVS
jgi:hypothetical protein